MPVPSVETAAAVSGGELGFLFRELYNMKQENTRLSNELVAVKQRTARLENCIAMIMPAIPMIYAHGDASESRQLVPSAGSAPPPPDLVFDITARPLLVQASPAFCRTLGYTAAELLKTPLSELFAAPGEEIENAFRILSSKGTLELPQIYYTRQRTIRNAVEGHFLTTSGDKRYDLVFVKFQNERIVEEVPTRTSPTLPGSESSSAPSSSKQEIRTSPICTADFPCGVTQQQGEAWVTDGISMLTAPQRQQQQQQQQQQFPAQQSQVSPVSRSLQQPFQPSSPPCNAGAVEGMGGDPCVVPLCPAPQRIEFNGAFNDRLKGQQIKLEHQQIQMLKEKYAVRRQPTPPGGLSEAIRSITGAAPSPECVAPCRVETPPSCTPPVSAPYAPQSFETRFAANQKKLAGIKTIQKFGLPLEVQKTSSQTPLPPRKKRKAPTHLVTLSQDDINTLSSILSQSKHATPPSGIPYQQNNNFDFMQQQQQQQQMQFQMQQQQQQFQQQHHYQQIMQSPQVIPPQGFSPQESQQQYSPIQQQQFQQPQQQPQQVQQLYQLQTPHDYMEQQTRNPDVPESIATPYDTNPLFSPCLSTSFADTPGGDNDLTPLCSGEQQYPRLGEDSSGLI